MSERHVDVYRYKSIRAGGDGKWTTDQYIEDMAEEKKVWYNLLDAMKEVAVDCVLNKSHNFYYKNINVFNLMNHHCLMIKLVQHTKDIWWFKNG